VLQDTRRLRNSFKAEVLDDGLSLFTDRVFSDGITAEIHQFGGTHPRSQVFIPPRELLPFKDNLPTTWLSWAEVFHSIGIDRIFK
jgi:phage gpG-like protein